MSAVSRPTRPSASGDCQLHSSRPGMFQCRSQSPGREAPCRRTCLPVLAIPDCSCSRITVRGTSSKSIEVGVVTDCKRRPSGGLPAAGSGAPLPFGPSRRAAASLLTRSAPNSRTPAPPCALSSARLNPGEFGLHSGSNLTHCSSIQHARAARTLVFVSHTQPHSGTVLYLIHVAA